MLKKLHDMMGGKDGTERLASLKLASEWALLVVPPVLAAVAVLFTWFRDSIWAVPVALMSVLLSLSVGFLIANWKSLSKLLDRPSSGLQAEEVGQISRELLLSPFRTPTPSESAVNLCKLWLYKKQFALFESEMTAAHEDRKKLDEVFSKLTSRTSHDMPSITIKAIQSHLTIKLAAAENAYAKCFNETKNMALNPYYASGYEAAGVSDIPENFRHDYQRFKDTEHSMLMHSATMQSNFLKAISETEYSIEKAALAAPGVGG